MIAAFILLSSIRILINICNLICFELLILSNYMNNYNKVLKTGTVKPDKIKNIDFQLSLDNKEHTKILASMKL